MSTRAALPLIFVVVSCSNPQSVPNKTVDAGSFDKSALVTALGNCALDTYRAFEVVAKKLASEPSKANWIAAMDVWQEVEVMQFGPLGATSLPGGQALRDPIYAWPLLGRCQIDRALANKTYEAPDFATTSLVTTRGLGALEYLLFYAGTDNGCGSSEDINASGTWAAISKDELTLRKTAYAKVLANDLSTRSAALINLWSSGFLEQFNTAGKGSTLFKTHEAALASVFDAALYVDSITKDRKVAIPIGLVDPATCAEPPCAELLESKYAVRAKQHVRSNLVALRKMLIGCGPDFAGPGFDDLFDAIAQASVADELDTDIKNAIAAVDAFPYSSFEEAMAKGDLESIKKIQVAIKEVTDALKVEFKLIGLDVPMRVAGDMD